MKHQITKSALLFILLFLAGGIMAQATTKKPTTKSKTTKTKTTTKVTKVAPSAITVKLTSKCEKDLMIYAGPKDKLRDPKQREVGGLSVNTLYLKTGDVICIMDAKKKPTSCINVTKETPALQINSAGTAIGKP
jgi:hypothetical protein